MLTETRHRLYTLEEYRQLEKTAEFRNEYRDGEIVPMTEGTINHNRITGNIYAFLKSALRGNNAEAFMNDLRLWIPRHRRGTYPDVMVISGQPVFSEGRQDEILNPILIVEVLSKSTEDFDRENKFRFYRSIPEFREYILVDQYEFLVEQYVKNESGQWLFQEYEGETPIVSFASVGVQMSMSDIYEAIVFETDRTE
ncbi:MAG: Uma2 family endonuclease [Microcoleus sp. CSU_2_2]|nr:Uma2 family endonuclease [Microcoleus sp. SU_5_3]NJS11894.1 Uma2 family endonuclease [Microcoleus sp. CSU_2_2]